MTLKASKRTSRRLNFTNRSTRRVTSTLRGRQSFCRPHFFGFALEARRGTMARGSAPALRGGPNRLEQVDQAVGLIGRYGHHIAASGDARVAAEAVFRHVADLDTRQRRRVVSLVDESDQHGPIEPIVLKLARVTMMRYEPFDLGLIEGRERRRNDAGLARVG